MTLTKQLWLAVVSIMIIAFGISFLASAWSAKSYLEDQLRLKNVDNANSLALSMSQMDKDPVLIELLVSAQFDIGHYKQIKLVSPSGKVMIERVGEAVNDKVPAWFVNLIPLVTEPGVALVQDGWRQYGTLTVISDNRFAYLALWQGNLRLLLWFLVGALLCGVVGTFILRAISRPLGEVVKQAEAIGARRFITIEEPRTREFRNVVRAMNAMSHQVRGMLDEESARLERLRRDAQHDALTGLLNREHFLNKIEYALEGENAAPTGALFIVRLPDLVKLNKELGRETADTLLKQLANALQESCPDESSLIGRLNGSDFAVLAPDVDSADELARQIFARVMLAINDPSALTEHIVLLGAAVYRHGDSVSQMLSRADMALGRAEIEGGSVVEMDNAIAEWKPQTSLVAAWQVLIETALNLNRVQFATYPVLNGQGELIHYEAPARMQVIQSSLWMSAQEFMPWASRLGLTQRIDEAVFEHALSWLGSNPGPVCVNVSAQSVCDPMLTARYYRALKANPDMAQKLWIDVPEFVAYRHAREFRVFCDTLKPLGCKIGLEHVGNQICHMGELYDVGLDYLKIDSVIIRDIDQNVGNQTFLRGLCTIAYTMGMMTIAEGVLNQQEAVCLKNLGFKGMTGPGIVLG
ncbi:MAG: LapD/MoxY N-terminal periplasmic domain-containing protein [Thiobacillus sp.]|nr:LapD/MoxY N-terminal periplasmic domain-containing protein [Thiobacillus sp.]